MIYPCFKFVSGVENNNTEEENVFQYQSIGNLAQHTLKSNLQTLKIILEAKLRRGVQLTVRWKRVYISKLLVLFIETES